MIDKNKILNNVEKILIPYYRIGKNGCRAGHDLPHVKRMIAICEMIFTDKDVDMFLLKLAILFHNIDRSQKFKGKKEGFFINKILSKYDIKRVDVDLVINAVENHSHLNTKKDSALLCCLKDCDMLDVGAIGILRIAAIRGENLPIYLQQDFFQKTKDTSEKSLQSMVQDIDRCLDWFDLGMIRNKKARALGKRRFAFMRNFRKEIKRELKEIGILKKV